MNGQWIGTYSGSSAGTIIANIDERPLNYEGVVYLLEKDQAIPSSAARFKTADKATQFRVGTHEIYALNKVGLPIAWEQIKDEYGKNVTFSRNADVTGAWSEDSLTLSWETDSGVKGSCILPRSQADKPSTLVPLQKTWSEFKEYVTRLEGARHLFRGQNKQWRLRTSFHRTGRADLFRFLQEDIQLLHKQLSARTKHVFNLDIPNENGAFFNLIQHHGYPTPLLDWTYSPYVAAFFAFRGMTNEISIGVGENEKVRIHVFDQAQWRTDWAQILLLANPGLYVSIGEFIAIENERMIPQQAASTVTNVDDIESYVQSREAAKSKKYLWAIDLPVSERQEVVRDLRYMGITAGSLFPGLDGMCEALAEQNFEV